MRFLVIVYCALTLLFAGGCATLLVADYGRFEDLFALPQLIVTLAVLANAAFLWMALKYWPGWLLMVGGVVYTALQCFLAWASGFWDTLGVPASIVFVLFLLKGAAVFFAGREAAQP